jgi:CHASE1-domain containing sensor protein
MPSVRSGTPMPADMSNVKTAAEFTEAPERRNRFRRFIPAATPLIVLMASLAFTLAMTLSLHVGVRLREQSAFDNVVHTTNDRITARLDVYVATLRGAAGLFASTDDVTAEMFRAYVERLRLARWYPGVQGIGWTRRLAWDPSSTVDEVHAITYIEPLDERNRASSHSGRRRPGIGRASRVSVVSWC